VVFSEGLQDEVRDSGIKIQALCPGFVITEFHDTLEFSHFNRKSIPDFLWMPVEKVVAESLKSLNSTKVVCIPGTIYSVVSALGLNSFTSGVMKGIARSILRRR
jgi:short-subunit dehydrogenase